MDKVKDIVSHLNPAQVPVIAADKPIYATAKQIHRHWPERYGEDKFIIMFGGLHIEMAAFKSICTLLQDSGLNGALVESGIHPLGLQHPFCLLPASQEHAECTKLQRAVYTSFKTKLIAIIVQKQMVPVIPI